MWLLTWKWQILLTNDYLNFGQIQLEKEIQSKEQLNRGNAYNDLSGQIGGAKSSSYKNHTSDPVDTTTDFDTLDEPVIVTIKRDARLIGAKFIQVLMPPKNQDCLRDWDLWGPLFVCVVLALYGLLTYCFIQSHMCLDCFKAVTLRVRHLRKRLVWSFSVHVQLR